jgi:hypothetical protein
MEITAQIAALEEEVKILKGEIKSILEEIRSAVLAQDNPFGPQSGLGVFRPIERSDSTGEPSAQPNEASPGPTTPPVAVDETDEALAGVAPAESPGAPPGDWGGPQMASLPATAGAGLQAEPLRPRAEAGPEPAPLPPMRTGNPEASAAQPAAEAPTAYSWSVSTIASLVAWVDETTSRLGTSHLQMILDLARFAGLLPQEAEEALLKVIKLASSRKDSATVSVNDTLVALRQLEAIFQGTESDDLSVLRRRRNAGRNR